MRTPRLFWKIFALLGLVSGLLALALLGLLGQQLYVNLQDRHVIQLEATARVIKLEIQRWWEPEFLDQAWLAELVTDLTEATGLEVAVLSPDGEPWADSGTPAAEWRNQRNRPEIQHVLRSGTVGMDQRRGGPNQPMRHYRAWPVMGGSPEVEPIAYLRLGQDIPSAWIFVRHFGVIAGFALMVWGAALTLLYFWLGDLLAPLEQLARSAEEIAAGRDDLMVPFHDPEADEVGVLAAAVQHMQANRADRHDQLQEKSDLLTTVLGNMLEGVVAVGRDGTVLLANAASGRMLGFPAATASGRVLLELTRSRPLRDAIQRSLQTGQAVNQEIESPGSTRRTLAIRVAPLAPNPRPGVMVVIHDVTELRRLENLRREFVANVSHELKTPLASVKAYAETLRLGAIEDKEHRLDFVARIEEQAERLHELIVDMLHLARVEAGREAFEIVPLSLREFVEECLHHYQPAAESKEMALKVEENLPELVVMSDEEGLRTILNNLVDNALKYTPKGGRVTVSWTRKNHFVELAVSDTGIGIAEREQARVFERFYRVDKARSRELGGTGLGLAIVKHLAQAFGGDVGIRSRLGVGSTFFVQLPLAGSAVHSVG